MRKTFAKTLVELAKKDKDIFLITGELGYGALEEFWQTLPKQFLNAGVSEQNMISMAAGMAMAGKNVYVYSIIPFATMRPFEQIRLDLCYQNLNVKIVGVGAGFSYSMYGASHLASEDIAIMRALPNMTVVCPGDPLEAKFATIASVKHKGPMYLRLAKAGEPIVNPGLKYFKIGRAVQIRQGKDACIIATSNLVQNASEAVKILTAQKINCRLLSMHTIKPIDKLAIIKAAKETKAIVTLEEHNIIGGLGSAVAEVLAESGLKIKFKRLGSTDEYPKVVGSQKFLRAKYGLSIEKVARFVHNAVKKRS